jgi:hypothetical protein
MFEHSARASEPDRPRFFFVHMVAPGPPVVRGWSFVIRPAVLVPTRCGCFWMGAAKAAGGVRGWSLLLAKWLRDVTQSWVWRPGMLE